MAQNPFERSKFAADHNITGILHVNHRNQSSKSKNMEIMSNRNRVVNKHNRTSWPQNLVSSEITNGNFKPLTESVENKRNYAPIASAKNDNSLLQFNNRQKSLPSYRRQNLPIYNEAQSVIVNGLHNESFGPSRKRETPQKQNYVKRIAQCVFNKMTPNKSEENFSASCPPRMVTGTTNNISSYESKIRFSLYSISEMKNDAIARANRGMFEESYQILRYVLSIQRKTLGNNPEVANTLYHLGYVLNQNGKSNEALECLHDALRVLRNLEGKQGFINADYALIHVKISEIEAKKGNYKCALHHMYCVCDIESSMVGRASKESVQLLQHLKSQETHFNNYRKMQRYSFPASGKRHIIVAQLSISFG